MNAADFPIGTTLPALVTNFYGVYEVEARVVALGYEGKPAFVFDIPMVRGKGGKETYFVYGSKRGEDAGFCLL
jgi:hypothetical protein